jgi:Ala-tRNA(Pro) deacylase
MEKLYACLAEWGIPFERFDHPAVFTCSESDTLCPPMPGAHTKQLLLRDKKGERNILAIVMHDKKVDMRELGRDLQAKDLSFASPERLKECLGVEPGSVTPFGLIFDHDHKVEIIIDEDAWAIGTFRFHPLINTATLVIDRKGFEGFLSKTGHTFETRKIPQK